MKRNSLLVTAALLSIAGFEGILEASRVEYSDPTNKGNAPTSSPFKSNQASNAVIASEDKTSTSGTNLQQNQSRTIQNNQTYAQPNRFNQIYDTNGTIVKTIDIRTDEGLKFVQDQLDKESLNLQNIQNESDDPAYAQKNFIVKNNILILQDGLIQHLDSALQPDQSTQTQNKTQSSPTTLQTTRQNISIMKLKAQKLQTSVTKEKQNIDQLSQQINDLQQKINDANEILSKNSYVSSFLNSNAKTARTNAQAIIAENQPLLDKAQKDLKTSQTTFNTDLRLLDDTTTQIKDMNDRVISQQKTQIERNQAPQTIVNNAYYNVLDVVNSLQLQPSTVAALKKPITSIFNLFSQPHSSNPTPEEITAIKTNATTQVTSNLNEIVNVLTNDKESASKILQSIQSETQSMLSKVGSTAYDVTATVVVGTAKVVGTVCAAIIGVITSPGFLILMVLSN